MSASLLTSTAGAVPTEYLVGVNLTVATKKATDTNTSEETTSVTDNRTDPQTFGPDNGSNNIAAAWQGLYHLLGARVENWVLTADGLFVEGLTFDSAKIPDVATVIHDITYRGDKPITRDLPLLPTYFYVTGQEPQPFEDAGEMTAWMAKYFRGSGEGDSNRSPQYVKDAISAYKAQHNMAVRRGRPPKKIDIEALGNVDEAILSQVPAGELEKLQATLARILEANAATAAK